MVLILICLFNVEDAYPYTRKPVNQLTIKRYYDGKDYCVRLDKFEKGVVETIKAIKRGILFSSWWLVDNRCKILRSTKKSNKS
jgi:hypothetical protein